MAGSYPYYRKRLPASTPAVTPRSDGTHVDLAEVWPLPAGDPVTAARGWFDARAAAAINSATGLEGSGDSGPPRIWPSVMQTRDGLAKPWYHERDLLEIKWYGEKAPTVYHVRAKCLAALAYADFFPERADRGRGLRSMVSRAILAAGPGWCGTFGPGADDLFSLEGGEADYDMSEMFLVAIAYRHYWDISPAAREHLITQLLARGRVHRPRKDDTFTSGTTPNDWGRAGFVSFLARHTDIGETENHILMILTARYLTNQLMFRRDPIVAYDNRRNGGEDYPSCTAVLLTLLRRIIAGDFSEYNAKPYQSETRHALLNLCSYAYDHEVRLGARMVLDYLSAHMAVSSNDLRRLLPFRRRNEPKNSAHDGAGVMTVGLLDWQSGADPMSPYFAMQAGNLRGYPRRVINDPGADLALEVLSEYRLPPAIHGLFVDDRDRRFFQRLHRTRRDEVYGNRNADNMEIFAGSPSYLITAGGGPALYALNPDLHAYIDPGMEAQQLGVAVTTSFMPTGNGAAEASQLIQFGEFSRMVQYSTKVKILGWEIVKLGMIVPKGVTNYGVAPDFACGHQVWLPEWVDPAVTSDLDGRPVDPRVSAGFSFVNLAGASPDRPYGYFLAIHQEDASLPVAEIASRVNLSQTPCWRRIQRLEAQGVIERRVAIVDPVAIGLGISVFVEIEAADHQPEWLAASAARSRPCPK